MDLERLLWDSFATNGFYDQNFRYMIHHDGSLTLAYFLMRVQQVFRIMIHPAVAESSIRLSRYFQISADALRFRINRSWN